MWSFDGATVASVTMAFIAMVGTLFGGSIGKLIEGKFGVDTRRMDELAEIRRSQREEIDQLKIDNKECREIVDTWQERFFKQSEVAARLSEQNQDMLRELTGYKRLVQRLIQEINRLRQMVNEPPMIVQELIVDVSGNEP